MKLGPQENLAILMLASEPIKQRLHRLVDELDEATLLRICVDRIAMGQERYGQLDLANDARDWDREILEEFADVPNYDTFRAIKRSIL